jgi:hypothetical protein
MNEEQFRQLLGRARRNEAPAEILAAVELEPGLVTRASEGDGMTILHYACRGGHVDLVRDLVDRHSNVHQRSKYGTDALMYASSNNHIPVMEFLLSRGADMTARDNDGTTALGLAALYDKLSACKFLISRGSDLIVKNNKGTMALDIYCNSTRILVWARLINMDRFCVRILESGDSRASTISIADKDDTQLHN